MEFILFGAEEKGLIGSQHYVDNLTGKTIKGMINIDMIGNRGSSDCAIFYYRPFTGGNVLSDAIKQAVSTYSLAINMSSLDNSNTIYWSQSDHASFDNKGLPAVTGNECTFSPVYHSVNDKTDKISYSQITNTAKAIVGALGVLAF